MSRGADVYEILRHAADSEAVVADTRKQLMKVEKPGKARQLGESLVHYLDKRDYHVADAERVIKARAVVRVMNLDGVTILEGVLWSVDAKKARVGIKPIGAKGRATKVQYAQAKHSSDRVDDDEIGYTYTGMEQLVRFKVLDVPASEAWRLRP